MRGRQGSGLQFSFSAGFIWTSQPSLDSMSSDRQRTSRTRKPPSHVLEHWRDSKHWSELMGGFWIIRVETQRESEGCLTNRVLNETVEHFYFLLQELPPHLLRI